MSSTIASMREMDVRWLQRFQNYQKALGHLSDAVELSRQRELSYLEQQGLIQAFEFTHELAWNTLKDFLVSRGVSGLFGSRDATRQAFAKDLITDGELWMEMIRDRNKSSHVYDEAAVKEIVTAVTTRYLDAYMRMRERMSELAKEESS